MSKWYNRLGGEIKKYRMNRKVDKMFDKAAKAQRKKK